jgi:hypothetical protein
MPVLVAVSQATLERGSSARHASSYERGLACPKSQRGGSVPRRGRARVGEVGRRLRGCTIASETWSQILSGCPSPTDSVHQSIHLAPSEKVGRTGRKQKRFSSSHHLHQPNKTGYSGETGESALRVSWGCESQWGDEGQCRGSYKVEEFSWYSGGPHFTFGTFGKLRHRTRRRP